MTKLCWLKLFFLGIHIIDNHFWGYLNKIDNDINNLIEIHNLYDFPVVNEKLTEHTRIQIRNIQ